ncbi:uncharacterized protein [Gossypium hirsutum]|uniref:Uncharacterized protein n=1 Tax=Gossypium hirsutum TaxID=3635 RepID=A0A1U8ICQ1_GOSHI|nr:uncharacterized protein LOC107893162 [Gossypium hirsutum]
MTTAPPQWTVVGAVPKGVLFCLKKHVLEDMPSQPENPRQKASPPWTVSTMGREGSDDASQGSGYGKSQCRHVLPLWCKVAGGAVSGGVRAEGAHGGGGVRREGDLGFSFFLNMSLGLELTGLICNGLVV